MDIIKDIKEKAGIFLIGEVGVNYYDIAKKYNVSLMNGAKLMIDKIKENGGDAIKFQSYKAEKIASINSPAYWDQTEEPTTSQYELFRKYDKFGEDEYKELADYCKSKKIVFMSTPFDLDSADYLDKLMPIYKISSSDITNLPFIKHIAKKQKPIFLSTGASTIQEINDAIRVIKGEKNSKIVIMHCILSYPTKYEDCNLNMIKHLKTLYPKYLIGYSDHSKPDENMLTLTSAVILGAKVVEKHFTLDKSLPGNDHYHAMDPGDLNRFVKNIKLLEKILGKENKEPIESELSAKKHARRSLVATGFLSKGKVIEKNDITWKRPGTGIPPGMIDVIIGGTVLEDINHDEVLTLKKIKLKNQK